MLAPSALTILTAFVPFLAAIILLVAQFFLSERERDQRLAKVASILTFASALLLTFIVCISKTEYFVESVSFDFCGIHLQFEILSDRMTIVWLLLNSALMVQILFFSKVQGTSQLRSFQILALLLLAASQVIVLTNDAKRQWLIMSSSNWLLYGALQVTHQHGNSGKRSLRSLVMLGAADLFWMLGLLGVFLITGTLQIPVLTTPSYFGNLSESEASLFMTSVMSLLISIAIRVGFFPASIWTNEFTENSTRMALLGLFPLSIGGYLFFRWLPMIHLFPEPLTILLGLAALSAVLTAVSALFQSGLKQLQRLCSVLIAFVFIGVAANENLVPQMTGLFFGILIFLVTISLFSEKQTTKLQFLLKWFFVFLLLCGTLGGESILRAMLQKGAVKGVEIPPVMLPLLVLTVGLFVFGIFEFFRQTQLDNQSQSSVLMTMNLLWGMSMLLGVSTVPFLLSPKAEFIFQFPTFIFAILLSTLFIARSLPVFASANAEEISPLIKLCRNDYHVETIIERGIASPVRVGSLFIHLLDKYLLQGLLLKITSWLSFEIGETAQEYEEKETTLSASGLTLLSAGVLLLAIYFGL